MRAHKQEAIYMEDELQVIVATAQHEGIPYVVLTVGDQQLVLRPDDAKNVANALLRGVALS
jgi:hypothetical protein